MSFTRAFYLFTASVLFSGLVAFGQKARVQVVKSVEEVTADKVWLSHEHLLVDFIGAEKIQTGSWNRDSVLEEMQPFLEDLHKYRVNYFVDATPNYLGRDVVLLQRLSDATGISILTNTGLYGARQNQFLPAWAQEASAEELAALWIAEYREGIDGTSVKPGFIKIGVDASDPLDPMHEKLVRAAAITHLQTGLPIASHTGEAKGLWPQLRILKEQGVSPGAFIWVHAQNEKDPEAYDLAAKRGCWISLDGMGWEIEEHLEKIRYAREKGFLNRVLISHDAGWYDPQKKVQDIKPYTDIFTLAVPRLRAMGFTEKEIDQLLKINPARAYAIEIRAE